MSKNLYVGLWCLLIGCAFTIGFATIDKLLPQIEVPLLSQPKQMPKESPPIPPKTPKQYVIKKQIPGYLKYPEVHAQLQEWNKEAPEITDISSYGKSSKGTDIYYMRMCGDKNGDKPKVLITACIHGNEWIANASVMGIMGKMLHAYGRDEKVTKLINDRDIYWVPVVSPDSYAVQQRQVDGVDPNRNFPYPGQPNVNSVPPVAALRNFFMQHKFRAALSGHAYGQVYIYPWGYTFTPCEDDAIYSSICNKMATLSNYKAFQIRKLNTAPPYQGFEADWFYTNGAFGIVCEFGQQFIPPSSAIEQEVNRNYPAFLLFIEEAPVTNLKFK